MLVEIGLRVLDKLHGATLDFAAFLGHFIITLSDSTDPDDCSLFCACPDTGVPGE